MAKKNPPVLLYIIIFIVLVGGAVYSGGLLMRRNFLYATADATPTGIVLVNKGQQDWPQGQVYLDDPRDGIVASFNLIRAGQGVRIAYADFSKLKEMDDYELGNVWVRVEGYQDRQFPQPPVVIITH